MDRDLRESAAAWQMFNRRTLVLAPCLAVLARGMVNTDVGARATAAAPEWLATVEDLVRIETWRVVDGSNEADVVERIGQIHAKLAEIIDDFVTSNGIKTAVPEVFEWRDPEKPYWVFGWRVGTGAN